MKNSLAGYQDDYFLSKLSDSLEQDIKSENIVDLWININENHILLIKIENEEFVVEVESGEITSTANKKDYNVNNLISSGSYATTHSAVAELDKYKHFLSDKEIVDILQATTENSQIIPDEDVQQFIHDIFETKKDTIDIELKKEIENFLS